jgi:hypothetical protein
MELKETVLKSKESEVIIENDDYFRFIFKKTEKIACAVFYVMRAGQHISQNDVVVCDLEGSAQRLIHAALESLKCRMSDVGEKAVEIKYALLECEAKLRVAHAARLLDTDLLAVFVHEIDSVQRSLKKYTEARVVNPLHASEPVLVQSSPKRQVRFRSVESVGQSPKAGEVHTVDRRERVLTVIRDKGEATIKDIVEVISDCSEKTIQRELINLIKDSLILREGERRWSKYKLV